MEKQTQSSSPLDRAVSWVKTNQLQAVLGGILVVLVIAIGVTAFSDRKPSLYGLQFNAMQQQAACKSDPLSPYCLPASSVDDTNITNLAISGEFGYAKVNQKYSALVSVVNADSYTCILELVETKPKLEDAMLVARASLSFAYEPVAYFEATPKTAGTYTVVIAATCDPLLGERPTISIEKTFQFKALIDSDVPPVGQLGISARFQDGKVGQEYTTPVATVNGSSSGIYTCNLILEKVAPEVRTARLVPSPQLGGALNQEVRSDFKATPDRAGNYIVTLSASCNPRLDSKIKSLYVKKDFKWKVTTNSTNTNSGGNSGSSSGSACLNTANLAKLTPVYRFWSRSGSDHLYTTSAQERPSGYVSEGIIGYVYKTKITGTVPIYRSYDPRNSAHYYSVVNDATQRGYNPEGIIGYAYKTSKSGSVVWHRLKIGNPAYDFLGTTSSKERSDVLKIGYKADGTVANICAKNRR